MKALIISHNPMSTRYSIGKTLLSLFSSFKKEELGQLYIHTGKPEFDVCSSFYQVTDKDVLDGLFKRKVRSREVFVNKEPEVVGADKCYKKTCGSFRNRAPYRQLLRDCIWKLSPWYSKELKAWICSQHFTCIFVAIGSGTFLYNIALKISKDFKLPLYTYVCDDFYSLAPPKKPLGFIWKKHLMAKTEKLLSHSAAIVTICEEMSRLYQDTFGRPTYTVMTGSNYSLAEKPLYKDNLQTIRYFGKVSLNRYKALADIGRELDKLNVERNTKYGLEIYSDGINEKVKKEFAGVASTKFCGYVSGEEFEKKFFSADALLHVEAFDKGSIDRVRHSISTKIADGMASGIPMFAYGPDSVASIKHLLQNESAFVATDKIQLKDKLSSLFLVGEERLEVVGRAIKTAEKYHNAKSVSQVIYDLLNSSVDKDQNGRIWK